MATAVWNTITAQATDAAFRLWGKALSDNLAAAGLTKTSDTGQIDWTTVVTPPTATTYQGYEIWRFNDTAHATAPIFIKIEYGSGSTDGTRPSLRVSASTASNGAGTLTGVSVLAATALNTTGTGASSAANNFLCYNTDTGSLWVAIKGVDSASAGGPGMFFGIFRHVNDSGVPDTTGWDAIYNSNAASNIVRNTYSTSTGLVRTSERGGWGATVPTAYAASLAVSGTVPVWNYLVYNGAFQRLGGFFGVWYYDFALGQRAAFSPFGVSRTHICLNNNSAGSGSPKATSQGAEASASALLIFE
jgi:hypothetical protein